MKAVSTKDAPSAIGPYSQGLLSGDFLFVSGQIPIDPETGKLVAGDIKAQTAQVLDNIEAILRGAGLGLEDVVKVEVYLSDISDFSDVNEVYASRFVHKPMPARQAMEVASLPLGSGLEISCIAHVKKTG